MAQQIQLRNDTTAGWNDSNPTLAQGEIGINTTLGQFKIGDGTTAWADLDYASGGATLTLPLSIQDTNGDDLLVFEKGYTGVARIDAVQDDLALRSARDIILYPGDDGAGKVYINWGDANYTPNATNEVATLADINEAIANAGGLDTIKVRIWGYPTEGAVAIMPETDNEAISLKSSDSAAIRWHVRNNSSSVVANGVLSPTSAEVTPGDGNYQVVFTIPEQDSVPPTGNYYYQITCPNNAAYNASLYAQAATTTTITFYYEGDPGAFDPAGAEIYPPSVYSQFEVDENGAHVKIADWSAGMGSYSYYWNFQNNGGIEFPSQSSNSRTGYGEVLKFGNPTSQSVITGASATYTNPAAQRIVVAGPDGTAGDGYDGEGGDVYLWAGQGGGTNGDGGDIKLDGGNGQGTGAGGYVKMRGGYSPNANGGFVEILGGDSFTGNGGDITIEAGRSNNGDGTAGGDVNINAGYSNSAGAGGNINLGTSAGGKITLNGEGGEFLNDDSVPANQIATQGYVATSKSTFEKINVYYETPVEVSLSHVGSLLYAAVAGDTFATYQIPTNASVAFPVGSEIKFATNGGSVWFISAADTETTTLVGEGSNGYTGVNYNFILPTNATATLLKVEEERWILSGVRLTD